MIINPKIGMRVKCIDGLCCDGMEEGEIGRIIRIDNKLELEVELENYPKVIWYQCKRCLEECKEEKSNTVGS